MASPAGRSPDSIRPIVVCPLRFELSVLKRCGLGRDCDLECAGPGAEAMTNWARSRGPARRPVILAGLAGALRPDRMAGEAYVITEVRPEADEPDRWLRPTSQGSRGEKSGSAGCIVTSAGRIASTRQEKATLARLSGADVVDLESVAFATAASSLGWRWGIVRGISDGPTTDLPKGIEGWIDTRGHLRAGAILATLCHRPGLVFSMRRLRRDGLAAMRAVAAHISAWPD